MPNRSKAAILVLLSLSVKQIYTSYIIVNTFPTSLFLKPKLRMLSSSFMYLFLASSFQMIFQSLFSPATINRLTKALLILSLLILFYSEQSSKTASKSSMLPYEKSFFSFSDKLLIKMRVFSIKYLFQSPNSSKRIVIKLEQFCSFNFI